MALESATYISDLNSSNPTAGDPASQGDDHLRLVKSTVKATFPNVSGAVTPTHTELNYVDGVTSAIQTQLDQSKATNGTVVVSTSGTSIDFTSIPSWVKRITVTLAGVSTSSTSPPILRLGDSGGVESTGYTGSIWSAAAGAGSTLSSGFLVTLATGDTTTTTGSIQMVLQDAATNTWVATSVVAVETPNIHTMAGWKALTATLDRVRITTVDGTATFDAGKINIQYD